MNKFYFVRHGQNEYTKKSLLTQLGMKQSAWAGLQLPKGIPIYSSPLTRASQTASIISGINGSEVVHDDRLKERFDISEIANNDFSYYKKLIDKSNKDPNFELPNGQSVAKNGYGVFTFLRELAHMETAVLVTHSGTILDFAKEMFPESDDEYWQRFRTPYASISIFELHGKFEYIKQVRCPYVGKP